MKMQRNVKIRRKLLLWNKNALAFAQITINKSARTHTHTQQCGVRIKNKNWRNKKQIWSNNNSNNKWVEWHFFSRALYAISMLASANKTFVFRAYFIDSVVFSYVLIVVVVAVAVVDVFVVVVIAAVRLQWWAEKRGWPSVRLLSMLFKCRMLRACSRNNKKKRRRLLRVWRKTKGFANVFWFLFGEGIATTRTQTWKMSAPQRAGRKIGR